MPVIRNEGDLEKWVKAIGQSIIDKASDIGRDTKRVTSVTIHAEVTLEEILNFDITKNYIVDLNKEV